MSRAKILQAGLFVAVVATGASALAWIPSHTETGIAMRESDGASVATLADGDGGGPNSAARYAELQVGDSVPQRSA
jgi:hypothetical protein